MTDPKHITVTELLNLAKGASFLDMNRGLVAAAHEIDAQAEQIRELTARLVERANEEPPTGWLRPGEDGYENTPEGARARAEKAEADLALAKARCERLRFMLDHVVQHMSCGDWLDDPVHCKLRDEARAALADETFHE